MRVGLNTQTHSPFYFFWSIFLLSQVLLRLFMSSSKYTKSAFQKFGCFSSLTLCLISSFLSSSLLSSPLLSSSHIIISSLLSPPFLASSLLSSSLILVSPRLFSSPLLLSSSLLLVSTIIISLILVSPLLLFRNALGTSLSCFPHVQIAHLEHRFLLARTLSKDHKSHYPGLVVTLAGAEKAKWRGSVY